MPSGLTEPPNLARALLFASDWFNEALTKRLGQRGWPHFNRTQSQVFALLADGTRRPAELARRVGITRQSMHTVLAGLVDQGLLAIRADPDDGRAMVVHLSRQGTRLIRAAAEVLEDLEDELERRIGRQKVAGLRKALSADWGPTPTSSPPKQSPAGSALTG